jgi:2-keto-3-deoxy-L-rhamnonate aldolase RhmA
MQGLGLKKALQQGPVFGLVHALGSAAAVEMICAAGFDFVLIDGEHGLGGQETLLHCLIAARAGGAHAVARVPNDDASVIKRVLDLGPDAIMAPNIASGDQAKRLVESCRYPPRGVRGFAAGGVRASDYAFNTQAYLDSVEDRLALAAMIESPQGVDNVGAIAAVEGVDIIQIGANDLSYGLGLPGQFDHPNFLSAIAKIEDAARAHGKILGGAPYPGTDLATLVARGYRLLTMGRDLNLLCASLSDCLSKKPGA